MCLWILGHADPVWLWLTHNSGAFAFESLAWTL